METLTPTCAALEQALMQRASVRRYDGRPVDDDLLNRLFTAAARTQTMGNLQLYSVVATRDAAQKAALAPAHFNQPMVTGAPVVLTFCADYRRPTAWCLQRKAHPGYDNFLSFINAATDALLFCQPFCTLAEAEGLGLCYLGATISPPQAFIDVLHLPRLVMPVATITLGRPAGAAPLADRLPATAFVHHEHYVQPTPESIDRDYGPREALEENRRFCEINHTETLAQIFTDIRYTAADCRAMSETLREALEHQKFL